MRFEFKLPDLAEGMVEGEIVSWLVEVGAALKEEQPVLEVMTDKATVVISSPHAGNLLETCYEAGDIAEVGSVLFVLDVEGAGEAPARSGGLRRRGLGADPPGGGRRGCRRRRGAPAGGATAGAGARGRETRAGGTDSDSWYCPRPPTSRQRPSMRLSNAASSSDTASWKS